jgi:hypothetical protein
MLQSVSDEVYLTPREVRSILRFSNRTLQRRRWDGTLKPYAVNSRCFLYAKSEVDSFIAKLKTGELHTVTFDKAGQPRVKQTRKRRRSRGSRKAKANAPKANPPIPFR